MYVCTYVCMYVCMYTHIYIYIYIYTQREGRFHWIQLFQSCPVNWEALLSCSRALCTVLDPEFRWLWKERTDGSLVLGFERLTSNVSDSHTGSRRSADSSQRRAHERTFTKDSKSGATFPRAAGGHSASLFARVARIQAGSRDIYIYIYIHIYLSLSIYIYRYDSII